MINAIPSRSKQKTSIMSTPILLTPSPKYALYDYSGEYGSYVIQWTHDFKGRPLRTLEQAQEMVEMIGSKTMGIEKINQE